MHSSKQLLRGCTRKKKNTTYTVENFSVLKKSVYSASASLILIFLHTSHMHIKPCKYVHMHTYLLHRIRTYQMLSAVAQLVQDPHCEPHWPSCLNLHTSHIHIKPCKYKSITISPFVKNFLSHFPANKGILGLNL